jgi:hypothetical protein
MAYATAANQSVAASAVHYAQPAQVVTPPQPIAVAPPQIRALPAPKVEISVPADARTAVLEVLADADGHWLSAREIADGALELGWQPSGSDPVPPIRSAASKLAEEGEIVKGMRNGRTAEFALQT